MKLTVEETLVIDDVALVNGDTVEVCTGTVVGATEVVLELVG